MYTADGKKKGRMNESLHCNCETEDNHNHETNCLVGAIHGVAFALKLLGSAVVQEGLSELTVAIGGIGEVEVREK